MNFQGALISVGGTIDPIVKALDQARPSFVLFVVSSESKRQLREILKRLSYIPQYNSCQVTDVSDLAACYENIRAEISRWLAERDLNPDDVYVDITSGTKPM